ncbi:hypothetical protein [Bacillus cereus]|nr:hypothetical protein [Bacillus cereus]
MKTKNCNEDLKVQYREENRKLAEAVLEVSWDGIHNILIISNVEIP